MKVDSARADCPAKIITQKGVGAMDARNSRLENGSNAAKTSVRAPGLSTGMSVNTLLCHTLGLADKIFRGDLSGGDASAHPFVMLVFTIGDEITTHSVLKRKIL